MPQAAAVKFKAESRSVYYNPHNLDLKSEDFCVVRHAELNAERVGFVSCLEGRAAAQMLHLPKVLRAATEKEIEGWYELKTREKEMLRETRECAVQHKLQVKVSEIAFVEDRRQAVVYFTSDNRVDFRDLVRDLAGRFKARIEMWQVGARKEAGMHGGLGICGRELCCSCHLKDFPTVSMRHAKDQDIIQPPSKLSGPCGRLRCCLRYEHEAYLHLAEGAPAVGCSGCSSGGGCGVVVDRSLLKQEAIVQGDDGVRKAVAFADFKIDHTKPRVRSERSDSSGGRRGRSRAPEAEPDSAEDSDRPVPPDTE